MTDSTQIDILAIAAHRDDAEQTCGGTLLKMAALGWRTGILDLTQGESGTRGTAAERAAEAAEAARILGVRWRDALDLPDGRVENTWDNRLKVASVLRQLRPRVVILPFWQGRHPDHYTASILGYEACFLSGLAKVQTPHRSDTAAYFEDFQAPADSQAATDFLASAQQPVAEVCAPDSALHEKSAGGSPHRPFKVLYASLYADVRPSFVIDITDHIERRFNSLMAYKSQYADQAQGSELFVQHEDIRERTFALARACGLLAGVRYAEPFVQKEVGLADDVMMIPVQSI